MVLPKGQQLGGKGKIINIHTETESEPLQGKASDPYQLLQLRDKNIYVNLGTKNAVPGFHCEKYITKNPHKCRFNGFKNFQVTSIKELV